MSSFHLYLNDIHPPATPSPDLDAPISPNVSSVVCFTICSSLVMLFYCIRNFALPLILFYRVEQTLLSAWHNLLGGMPSFIFYVFVFIITKEALTRPLQNSRYDELLVSVHRSTSVSVHQCICRANELYICAYHPAPEPLYCPYAGPRLSESLPFWCLSLIS